MSIAQMLKSHLDLSKLKMEMVEPEVGDEQHEGHVGSRTQKDDEKEDNFYPKPEPKVLTREEVGKRLSFLGKIAEGDGYAYLKATCTGMYLTDISAIKHFKHLQYVDVSNNFLNLNGLQVVTELPFLIYIQADKNHLCSAALKTTKYLQVIVMNNNNISRVDDVYQPELCTLEAGYNKITNVYFNQEMPQIKCLDFRYNLIEEITDFDFVHLDSLYLAGNKIKTLLGIERLVNLRILHVRHNPIKFLDGFEESHKKLKYVNLRNCKVATLRQVKKLRGLTGLETLIIKGCPYMGGTGEEGGETGEEEEDSEIRVEVIATLPRLKRLNKGVITPEERNEAKDLMSQWLEEGEKDEEEIEDEQREEQSNAD